MCVYVGLRIIKGIKEVVANDSRLSPTPFFRVNRGLSPIVSDEPYGAIAPGNCWAAISKV